jgi:hypothetical protein
MALVEGAKVLPAGSQKGKRVTPPDAYPQYARMTPELPVCEPIPTLDRSTVTVIPFTKISKLTVFTLGGLLLLAAKVLLDNTDSTFQTLLAGTVPVPVSNNT